MPRKREVKINAVGEAYLVEIIYTHSITPLEIEERKKYVEHEIQRLTEDSKVIAERIADLQQELNVLKTINTSIPPEKVRPDRVIGKWM
ncbi:MAG: hypothetical protein K6U74_13540 [Firmicutes bacterium]|nr:hypothetical protein [Bacillota bacterium]